MGILNDERSCSGGSIFYSTDNQKMGDQVTLLDAYSMVLLLEMNTYVFHCV